MSVPHSKVAEISAAPRLVTERKSVSRGIPRRACSTGVVTCSTICWAGRSPASSEILTRGNWDVGEQCHRQGERRADPCHYGQQQQEEQRTPVSRVYSVSADEFISDHPHARPCHPATRNCRP